MKTIIHVNQHKIRSNIKNDVVEPVLTVKSYKSNIYAHEVEILGPSKIVYSPKKPLSCGARVWIETESEVITKWNEYLGVGNAQLREWKYTMMKIS
jgi:hypothetical protein